MQHLELRTPIHRLQILILHPNDHRSRFLPLKKGVLYFLFSDVALPVPEFSEIGTLVFALLSVLYNLFCTYFALYWRLFIR